MAPIPAKTSAPASEPAGTAAQAGAEGRKPTRDIPYPRPPRLSATARADLAAEIHRLSNLIQDGSADDEAYASRVGCLITLGQLDDAEHDLQVISSADLRERLQADLDAARGDFRNAADEYKAVLDREPQSTGTARKLARMYVATKTFHPDEVAFVEATLNGQFDRIVGSPDWVPWVTFLHERLSAEEEWERDLTLLRSVGEHSPLPENPRLGLWTVDTLLALGRVDEALGVLAELPVEKGHEAALTACRRVGRELARQGLYAEAKPLFERIAQASGDETARFMAEYLALAVPGQRFVPVEKIGAGAVAEVWKAYDLSSASFVGLKTLRESLLEDAIARDEFRREYDAMLTCLSPRLARVIPGSFQNDRFAMELLEGSLMESLSGPEATQGLGVPVAVNIALQIAEGLEYLHARGYTYQDLSPQNVLFKDEDVKLCDLGGILPGASLGPVATVAKVAYASPEQCALLIGAGTSPVDHRSDVYSLGVVLYHMLTGRLPFEGPDQAVLHAHLYSRPTPPSIHRPEVGRELNAVVLKCMSRSPEDRYPSVVDLWDALSQVEV